MPNKCCVPGCTGNYKTGKKIQVFSFPKDADAVKQWLRAIPRKDFVPTSCTKVRIFDAPVLSLSLFALVEITYDGKYFSVWPPGLAKR